MAELTKIKVLYIDDEQNNLISFKAMFRHDYEVLIAGSAEEGEKLMEEHPDLKIVFCDQRMPAKTGVEFFKEISHKYPEPIRMLITGYIDIESVINAINHGHVFRYLTKPWREEEVRSAIEEGFKYYSKSFMLNQKIQELQQANAELDKFTYSVTHDIRGPVVSILGALQILKTLNDVDEMKQLLELMEQSAEKVKDLITNIHSYYNIKRGNLNINEINFTTLVEEIIQLHNVDALLNKVTIKTNVQQLEKFRSDSTVLRLIFNNLINNAIKYQRRNEENKWVNLSIFVQKGVCRVEVEDNGIGIPEEFKDEIFQMFFRATKESVGSGFGLYNVKDALSKLEGTIEVESSVDIGTKFVLTIPTK